jgi:4'-phosphopantetheinyl transferase
MSNDIMLPPDSVQVWTIFVDQFAPHRATFEATLSPDEQQRAARFVVDEPRLRFIIARSALRTILAGYLDVASEVVQFAYGERGKPSLPESDLRFNLSHSDNIIVIAVTQNHDIGVDVEHIHHIPEMSIMARDNFSLNEQETLFKLPEQERERAFFRCWTRKEAYIKATGDGFSMPLRDFDVTLTQDETPRILRASGDDPARWSLVHLEPDADYVGAICIEGRDFTVIHRQLD